MPRRRKESFLWIPPSRSTIWTCTIGGLDITNFIISGSFPHGLISEELVCEIELDNSGEDFTNTFKARDIIEFKMDFSDGSTVQFKGEVEEIKSAHEGGVFNLKIKGAHFTAQLLDIMVTAEFTNAAISTIRTTLVADFLPDFTSNNIEENTTAINIKFVNKPFLDCMLALDIEGNEDTYIDFDKDFHTFKKNSHSNDNEAVVWDDSLITLRGLGSDSAEVRNKITVYGEADDLPIIHVSEDSVSQDTFRTKEKVITDNSVVNEAQAEELGDAENTLLKDPDAQGSATTLFMPQMIPGYPIYVIFPPQKIHDRFRPIKFTFRVPDESMEVFFNQERSIPKLFKDRIKKDLGQERIVNPFNMSRSFTFTFDNLNNIGTSASSNIEVSEGKLKKTSAAVEIGTMISQTKESSITANSMSLIISGENLDGATYFFRADTRADFQSIVANSGSETSISNPGTNIQLQIIVSSDTTRIDSAGLYWKT